MKIYQIVEYGGIWEDSYEYVLKTYLSKEKAFGFTESLQKKFEEAKHMIDKCFYECKLEWWNMDNDKELMKEIRDNCINADLSIESDGEEEWLSCSNNCSDYKDVGGYKIIEYEVEDGEYYG